MTQAEYARYANISRQAVNKLVQAGKIPVGHDGLIDAAKADQARGQSVLRVNEPAPVAAPAPIVESAGLTRARTATEVFRAKAAQLNFEKLQGKLVETDAVTSAARDCAAAAVRLVAGLSARAEEIAAAAGTGGAQAVRALLRDIERDLRTRMGEAFAEMARAAIAGAGSAAEDDVLQESDQ